MQEQRLKSYPAPFGLMDVVSPLAVGISQVSRLFFRACTYAGALLAAMAVFTQSVQGAPSAYESTAFGRLIDDVMFPGRHLEREVTPTSDTRLINSVKETTGSSKTC